MNLNPNQQNFYNTAYGLALQQGASRDIATVIASNAVLGSFKEAVPRNDLGVMQFDFQRSGEEIIVQTEGDEEFVTAVLAGEGKWTAEELQRFADSTNMDMPVGDIDHETLKSMIRSGMSNTEIKAKIKDKRGIVKAVKALVEDGKLYLRLAIDKRYKNIVKRARGLSVEAVRTLGEVGSGQFLGFTVAVNEDPAYSGATFVG